MRCALATLVVALGLCCVPGAVATASTTPLPVPVKSLIFDAEFNGRAGTPPGHRLWGAKHFDNWSGWSHITLNGAGSVVLTAYKDSAGWHTPWLSGKIGYSGRRYVEARADVPCGAGTWAAPIWEWRYPYGRTPGFENDVAEQLGHEPTEYHATLHHWTSGGGNVQSSKELTATSPLCGTFHTYGAAVFSNRVDFYLDGALTTSIPASAIGYASLTNPKEVINIDLAVGGLGGAITLSGPIVLAVDFIHVYRM
jgi:Glycosyl hydrolases family 16